ncbi:hypothetical protein [Kitasatospora sp. NPDC088351]|uniref:hypothetical protein n=1 Tax=Kitasatospora sp. NPDC088351 TaxID=3155180 RepID=UPI00341A250E
MSRADGLQPVLGRSGVRHGADCGEVHGATGWSVVVHDRDEGGYHEHAMGFAEWLHRHLLGEVVIHPGGTYVTPGPVKPQHLPMSPNDRPVPWYGPERGV